MWKVVASRVGARAAHALEFVLFSFALIVFLSQERQKLRFESFNPDFVDNQFRSTRDAAVRNPFSKWLWGGMRLGLYLW